MRAIFGLVGILIAIGVLVYFLGPGGGLEHTKQVVEQGEKARHQAEQLAGRDASGMRVQDSITLDPQTSGGRLNSILVTDIVANASATWRHHPLGLAIFSERVATGSYVVRFTGLQRASASDREGVVVNAYGSTAAVCQPGAPTSTATGLEVAVRCFDATGAAVDSRYTILLVDGARTGARLGFALADQPASAGYTPANSAVRGTGSVQITRAAAGTWDVAFTGLYRSGSLKESFLVSPVGTTAGRCWVNYWDYSSTAGGTSSARVSCATTAGVLVDMPFSIVAVQ